MGWISCYQAASETDARLLGAVLEREAIPCRVQPLVSSVFPLLGFEVCVPEDRLEAARTLVAAFEADVAPTSVEASEANAARAASPLAVAEGPPKLTVFRTFGNAIRLIGAHPTIFAATIPLFLWKAIALSLDLPQSNDAAMAPQELVADLPAVLLFDPLAAGLAISFAAEASGGPASWMRSLRHLVRRLPRLFALSALVGLAAGVPIVWSHFLRLSPPHWFVVPFGLLLLWLVIRLALVQVALVVDDVGLRGAIERSWALTTRNAWRILGLSLLTSLLAFPLSWVWPPAEFAIQTLMSPVLDVVLVLAHRELAGAGASSRSVVDARQLPDPSPA